MTAEKRIVFGLLFLVASADCDYGAPRPTDTDKDPQLVKMLQDARHLIDNKQPEAAIEKCDKVIASFKTEYGSSKQKIYCARSPAESLGYLLKAAAEINSAKAANGQGAIALSATWSDAYFLKAYALQDLGRIAEAKAAINLALQLSPVNSQYLCELGEIYQLEKNWSKAKEQFQKAEDNATLCPDEVKAAQLAQARRGSGYVYVELGKLAEAEKKYAQCLSADPNDIKAQRELEYVRGLQAKKKSR